MCTKALKEALVLIIKQTTFMLRLLKSTGIRTHAYTVKIAYQEKLLQIDYKWFFFYT